MTTTTVYNKSTDKFVMDPSESSSMFENVTDNPQENPKHHQDTHLLNVVSFVGAAISIVGILLTLLSYIGYRKFHVKRNHIVMVNLCTCLLLYFVAYLMSNDHRQDPDQYQEAEVHSSCLAGAFIGHFAALSAWFWITVYWLVLLVMFRRPLGGHISYFFLKAAFPSYGLSFLIAMICIVVAYARTENFKSPHEYYNELCFINGNYLYYGLLAPFALAFVPILIVFAYVVRGLVSFDDDSGRSQRVGNIGRVRMHLFKLSTITVLIAIMLLGSVIIPVVKREADDFYHLISTIIFTIVSAVLGVMLMVLFCLHQQEIRQHWMDVLSGKKHPIHHHSISGLKKDGLANSFGSSRKSSATVTRQPSLFVDGADDQMRSKSSSRIVPKEDTDMTTLGLIQIPGTPSSGCALVNEEKSEKAKKSAQRLRASESLDVLAAKPNREKSERSSLLVAVGNKKRRSQSSSSDSSKKRGKKIKHQRSFDRAVDVSPRDIARTPSGNGDVTVTVIRKSSHRVSTVSNDSTPITDFA